MSGVALPPLNILSLCSGAIDALALGVELAVPGSRCVCHVERDAFCAGCLVQAMEAGCLDAAPVWSDARTFDGRRWRGLVDCVIGGYPCQPFSFAGKRRGTDDPRHLWPVIARIVREIEPPLVFFENVAGHLSLGFPEVCGELEAMGYEVAAGLFTAEEVGAPHKRERLFIMAHRDGQRRQQIARGTLGDEASNGRARRIVLQSHGDHKLAGDVEGVAHPALGGLRILPATDGGQGGQPDGRDEAVDHAAGTRRAETGSGPELRDERVRQCVPSDSGGYVADAADAEGRGHEPERGQNRGGAAGRAGTGVAHSIGQRGQAGREDAADAVATIPLFPPGPADRDAWIRVLEADPTLEPAICGMAPRLAVDRRHWLRGLGNGVVPLQAAHAWETLSHALGITQ